MFIPVQVQGMPRGYRVYFLLLFIDALADQGEGAGYSHPCRSNFPYFHAVFGGKN